MGIRTLDRRVKPSSWPVHRTLVDPAYRWAWRGLRMAVPLWSTAVDVVTRQLHTPSSDAGWAVNRYGRGYNFNNTDSILISGAANLSLTGRFSGAFFGSVNAAASNIDHIFGFYASSGGFNGWGLACLNPDGFLQFWDGSAWRSSGVDPRDGLVHLWGFTYTGSAVRFYKDGLQIASVAASAVGAYTGAKRLGARSDNEATRKLNGFGSAFYLWDRELSASEHALLAVDPFGPLRQARRRVGFVVVGGGVTLMVQDALIALAAEAPALTQANVLAVNDALVSLGAENPNLIQAHILTVGDTLIALVVDNVVLILPSTFDLAKLVNWTLKVPTLANVTLKRPSLANVALKVPTLANVALKPE